MKRHCCAEHNCRVRGPNANVYEWTESLLGPKNVFSLDGTNVFVWHDATNECGAVYKGQIGPSWGDYIFPFAVLK